MNRHYIETHLAVDRYLRGALTDAETAEFEERLAWDEVLQDEVDLAGKLRDGLRAVQQADEIPASGPGVIDNVVALFQVPAYAAAASAVLAVGMTLFVLGGPTPDNDSPGGLMPTEIVPLFATRSTEAMSVAVSADAWSVLLVDAPGGFTSFRVTIRQDETRTEVWSRDGIVPTYPESLAVGMPGRLLADGAYVLTLDGLAAEVSDYERVQEIPFVVTRSD